MTNVIQAAEEAERTVDLALSDLEIEFETSVGAILRQFDHPINRQRDLVRRLSVANEHNDLA